MKRCLLTITGALALLGSSLAGAPPAAAAAPAAVSRQALTAPVTTAPGQPAGTVRRYWTAARMAHARPATTLPGSVLGALLAPPPAATRPPAARAPVRRPLAAPASVASTTGKVFFTRHGADYVCSGSAVTSDNRDLVITAGHCVHDGFGRFHSNWVFAPGRAGGRNPHGLWVPRVLSALRPWVTDGHPAYDVGAALLATDRSGRHLVDVVGGQGIAWNQPRNRQVTVFGYPAEPPDDGEHLRRCGGRPGDDPSLEPAPHRLACSLGEGASGGPWLTGFDGRRGTLYSVTSFRYAGDRGHIQGPYFGDAVARLYQELQGA